MHACVVCKAVLIHIDRSNSGHELVLGGFTFYANIKLK